MPTQFTTNLPDVMSLALDASNAESLIANWSASINNGEFRIELRDDNPDGNHPPYEFEATVPWDETYQHTIQNILGGEQYSVRIRTQTEHVDGEWIAAEELTKLRASSDVTFANVAEASLDVQWTINNDFRGSHQIYRRRADYEYDGAGWDLVGSAASDAASYADGGVAPIRPYEYYVRTLTQWQYADSTVSSSVETADAGLVQSSTGSSGWHIEIDHPSGQTITPQVLDDARLEPRVNDLPRARIPVPRNEAYTLEAYEGADMRVWKDGDRQPIGELEDVVLDPGQTELVGIGGTQLQRRVDRDVVQEEAHVLAEDLITTETDYMAVVDEPVVEEVTDALLQAATAGEEFVEYFDTGGPDPIEPRTDALERTQTAYLFDAGEGGFPMINNVGQAGNDEFSGGDGLGLSSAGDWIETDNFTIEHTIAENEVGTAIRAMDNGQNEAQLEIQIYDAGTDDLVGSVAVTASYATSGPLWHGGATNRGGDVETWTSGDLVPGNYYLRVECTQSGDEVEVDVVSLHDMRYYTSDNFSSNVHEANGYLDEPHDYETAAVESIDAQTVYSVRTGYLDMVWNDTTGNQAIAVSNDSGRTWIEAVNTSSVSADFEGSGANLRTRLTAGGYSPNGARAQSPRYGYEPQRIESYELRMDGDDTPLVINDARDANIRDILTNWADRSDSLWEVRQDGDQTVIHWAQAGQRSSDRDLSLSSYSVTKRGDRTLRCTVKGGARTARETVDAVLDDPIALENQYVVSGSEAVRDADTGERYEYLRDYIIQKPTGTLEVLSNGSIADGQTLEVEYDYKVSDSYEADEYDGEARYDREETINAITTERGCELAAKLIVDTTSTPRWEADVEIPAGDRVGGLLEALDVDGIAGEVMSVYSLDVTPERLSLRLGSRSRVEETVQQIQSTVDAASDRV
ncbi:fibronectin type III domain-containing protein [Natrinema soli]|uniref:Fibronectin type III domain-containing protein n=1 Tax=Natrinema soli TaxID=1930624 RepID=A0ABD5SKD9_9EURY|nr:fibronectin type III domain-containing protein [Natrinema soli]